MIEFTTIESIIMTYSPLLVTILGIILAFIRIVKVVKEIRNDTTKNNEEKAAEIKALQDNMSGVINQNYELKKQLNELLTKLDNVKRE